MRPEMMEKIREWYILAIGAAVLIGGVAIASYKPGNVPGQAPAPEVAQRQAELSKTPSTRQAAATRPDSKTAQSSETSASEAHNHAAASVATADTGQTAPMPPSPDTAGAAQPSAAETGPRGGGASKDAPGPAAEKVEKPSLSLAPTGNATVGRQVYRKCQACHSLEAGKNTLGPSLAGIVGRKAGQIPNYNYSPALKNSTVVWDLASLDAYLTDPQKFIPGNKMPFPGLKTENERKEVIAYLAASASATPAQTGAQSTTAATTPSGAPQAEQPRQAPSVEGSSASYIPDIRYTLRSGIAEGRMVFIGVGGAIEGQVNPILSAAEGQVLQITLLNGEGAEHDIVFPEQNAKSPRVTGKGTSTTLVFRAMRAGDYIYICSVPGHELAGMKGQFLVTPKPPPQVLVEADISQKATSVPPPVGKREPQTIRVDLLTVELEGRLAEGTTFGYWTFNGRVPGPMLRVRVGDTLDVHVKNSEDATMIHSVDFHAATGPGGGAAATQVDPGQEKSFKFKALIPGLYVYHCATPMVAHHIANGMYGLILVEPEGGLPPVDREFYVMQGEVYTEAAFGQHGSQEFSVEKLLNERPEYFVFNGAVGALSKLNPLAAKVGETVRIFFGVGGPNYTSSFHVIGEIFDRVYTFADLQSAPARGIQTVTVPAGGAVMVEFKLEVPGRYILVDHALSRAERGLIGILQVEGQPNPEIFEGKVEPASGH